MYQMSFLPTAVRILSCDALSANQLSLFIVLITILNVLYFYFYIDAISNTNSIS